MVQNVAYVRFDIAVQREMTGSPESAAEEMADPEGDIDGLHGLILSGEPDNGFYAKATATGRAASVQGDTGRRKKFSRRE